MTDISIRAAASVGIPDKSRLETRENLDNAAEAFESIFVSMMMRSMRSTALGDDLLGSQATSTFRDMQDQQIAKEIAGRGALGIARALSDFLARGRNFDETAKTRDVTKP